MLEAALRRSGLARCCGFSRCSRSRSLGAAAAAAPTRSSSTATSSPSTRVSRSREAVAIAGGKFTAVGTNAAIRKLAGPKTTTIDLHGQTVIPGLADGHLHDAGGGPGVDLSRARSLADILAAVAARVKQSRPGDVIVINSDWHEAQLKEHRLPYRARPRHRVAGEPGRRSCAAATNTSSTPRR